MLEKDLKFFTINLINKKISENEKYIKYTYYELKITNNLTEKEIDEVLVISKNYLKNKGYKVYFSNEEFKYKNIKRRIESNEFMIAIKTCY